MKFNKTLVLFSIALVAFTFFSTNGFAQDVADKHKYFPKLFRQNKSLSIGLRGVGFEHLNYGAMGVNATFYRWNN